MGRLISPPQSKKSTKTQANFIDSTDDSSAFEFVATVYEPVVARLEREAFEFGYEEQEQYMHWQPAVESSQPCNSIADFEEDEHLIEEEEEEEEEEDDNDR